MKYLSIILTLLVASATLYSAADMCSLCLEPIWRYLDESEKHFADRWVLVGGITFKKKCIEPIKISKIHLRWHGEPLEELHASLYTNNSDDAFLPIEANLVCDGKWNKVKQKLILHFQKPYKIGLETTFYLVLTVPDKLEPLLRQGSFSIEPQCLPEPLRQASAHASLSLAAINTPSSIIH